MDTNSYPPGEIAGLADTMTRYEEAPLNICPNCHRSLSANDYRDHMTGSDGYTYCSMACAFPGIDPDTNTELAQLDADLAEQPGERSELPWHLRPVDMSLPRAAELNYDVPFPPEGSETYRARYAFLRADYARFPSPQTAEIMYVAWHNYRNALICEERAAQPPMLDPIATLPLFSGTAPRVADPGRFDPPSRSTDTQPALF